VAAAVGKDPAAALWGLVDALADGELQARDDGMLVLANQQAEDMFGYARGELARQPVEPRSRCGSASARCRPRRAA